MSNKKPVYLLAGGRPRNPSKPDRIIQEIFRESGKEKPSIAYIGTANGDSEDFFKRMTGAYIEAGAGKIIHAVIAPDGADLNKAGNILETADIIFISGGDVDSGMRILEKKGMIEILNGLFEQGKLFFGASAGAIMLAKEWVRWRDPDDSTSTELFPCLDFADVICDCHDEQGGWEELKAALMLEKIDTRGYGLVSGTALVVFPDGKLKSMEGAVHRYIRNNDGISRMPDIFP